ncbi:Aste57867_17471 [Aphanomyces stellatus]|uniref:Aste57867_17471 protein n=1 Tax=Aphanomyces stellatus TaxID=120398 RepID=A0A485LBG3_9STRA|nr:hypothetical protein As57867_017411 [Aphanomyces stellatus]VFT94225.1 Aste57867_17471 [Aphanomyces stellatus]
MPHPDFGSVEFWDSRYIDAGNRSTFEWFFPYKAIDRAFESYLRPEKSERVLILGCDLVMDARDMHELGDGSFDLIIDKGALDCVVCGLSNSAGAIQMMDEVRRVLHPDGTFFLFSAGTASNRLPYLKYNPTTWQITQVSLGQPMHVLALMLRSQAPTSSGQLKS